MNVRFQIILIFMLCGALLFSAGCTTTPSGGVTPAPTVASTPQVAAASPDLGTIVSLLQGISSQVELIGENTRPLAKNVEIGNIVLFDPAEDLSNIVTSGTYVVSLPGGLRYRGVRGLGPDVHHR